MQYKDLKSFTHDELSYFTWHDLTLGKLELLKKINQDQKVPDEIARKVYQLCDEIMKEIPGTNISLPTDKKKLTLGKANEILRFIINSCAVYKLIPDPIKQKITELIEMLANSVIK